MPKASEKARDALGVDGSHLPKPDTRGKKNSARWLHRQRRALQHQSVSWPNTLKSRFSKPVLMVLAKVGSFSASMSLRLKPLYLPAA